MMILVANLYLLGFSTQRLAELSQLYEWTVRSIVKYNMKNIGVTIT